MRILDRSVYVGPSLYARFPVIRLELDLGALEQWPTGRLGPAFVDALAAALPGLAEHGCSYREPGGFFRRMREDEGTWLGHVLEHVAIELQNVAGEEVTFGKTRSAGAPGVYTVVYEYAQRDEGIAAGELGAAPALLAAAAGACGRRIPCREAGTGPRRAMSSSALRSGARWDRPPPRWCARRKTAAFPGCASTISRWSNSDTANTSSASRPPSPAARRTSPWSWPATRRKPTRSSPRSACRCPRQELVQIGSSRPCAPRVASASRW